jgi:hypothetical protein
VVTTTRKLLKLRQMKNNQLEAFIKKGYKPPLLKVTKIDTTISLCLQSTLYPGDDPIEEDMSYLFNKNNPYKT